jgi:hypothetical protein
MDGRTINNAEKIADKERLDAMQWLHHAVSDFKAHRQSPYDTLTIPDVDQYIAVSVTAGATNFVTQISTSSSGGTGA